MEKEQKFLWVLIIVYVAVFGTFACLRHYHFQTQTWDLGAFVQNFWNSAHGRLMVNHLEDVPNHFGVHWAPFLLLLVPGYAIFESPYYLLLIQTLALGLAAWPLYLLARQVLQNNRVALLIAGVYFLYPTLHWLNMYDFHEEPFFVPLLFAAFYFAAVKRYGWAAVLFFLAASTKENSILVVLFAGLYLFFRRQNEAGRFWTRERRWGMAVVIGSLVYFLLAIKVFMPAFGGGLLRFDRYANLGATPGAVVHNVVNHPSLLFKTIFETPKMIYLFWLFVPVALLPFFSPASLLLVIPGIAQNLLTFFSFQFTGLYQYDGIIIPGMIIGAIFGLKVILAKWPRGRKFFLGTVLALAIISFSLRSPISFLHFPTRLFRSTDREVAFRQMIKLVPPNVSVAAQTNLVPHLSNRSDIYMLGREPFPVDMVLIDGTDNFGFPDDATFQKYFDSYASSGQYQIKTLDNRYAILIKKSLLAH